MRKICLFYVSLLAMSVLASCSNDSEEIEKVDPAGKTAVTIQVEGEGGDARTVTKTGGTAYGEGLYDGADEPTVGATAGSGYTIDYFYGGPSDNPKKYNASSGSTSASWNVPLNGKNHQFYVNFKKEQYALTLVAGTGGTVSGGGTYEWGTPISISASPSSGYTFSGWTVTSGDAKIANASSASTTATLQSSASTLTANWSKTVVTPTITFSISYIAATNDPNWKNYIVISASSNVELTSGLNCDISYTCTSYTAQGEAVNSGLEDQLCTNLISKGSMSGSKSIYGCGYNPTNLRITSVTINSPSGFTASY